MVLGGVHLRSSYNEASHRVTAHLSITSRRPPKYDRFLPKVLSIGSGGIFDRHATEADFITPQLSETRAGPIYAVGDDRLSINVRSIWLLNLNLF